MASTNRRLFEAGAAVARTIPLSVTVPVAEALAGPVGGRLWGDQFANLARNLRHVLPGLSDAELAAVTRRGFGSYARYWAESFTLPALDRRTIDDGFSFEGLEHILDARDAGHGPIVVLPHLGGWEWAAAWLSRVAEVPVTAVVEDLEPPDVFEWFTELRSSIGINVVPLGPRAASAVARAVQDRHVVCLVADRDLAGTGVPVELFGARTTMPAGPAVLARRLGAPILPTAVYFRRHDRCCRVGAPLDTAPRGTLREDVARITQDIARVFEELIGRAPEQWHVLAPAWTEAALAEAARDGAAADGGSATPDHRSRGQARPPA